jgi:dTDP-4-dehydrorhamnose 3,5-epimerase
MNFFEDDRAQRLLDIFNLTKGQLNISFVNSTSHIVAWHKHKIQTDFWICIKGSFKVGLVDEQKNLKWEELRWEYLSDKNFRVLEIPPGVYHGYRALEPDSILMYYVTEKYNPDDEYRLEVGAFGEDWNIQNK